MRQPHEESPLNPLPPVVMLLALAVVGVEFALQLGKYGLIGGPDAVGWRVGLMLRFGVIGQVFDAMWLTGQWPLEQLARLVVYPFIHGSFTHAIFAVVFILALGNMVSRVFSPLAVLAVFFGSSLVAGAVYAAALNTPLALIGAFPGAYGLIGAFSFLLWVQLAATGGPQSQAFTLIAFLMGIQLLFGLIFGGGLDWVADLVGFVAGFGLSFLVSPGGWARVMNKLRQR